jgi:hypothetical protein
MSYKLTDVAFDIPNLSKRAKAVLLNLARHAHDDGTEARPSVPTIAEQMKWSAREVYRGLRELEKCGLIIQTQAADKHSNKPAVYRLGFQVETDSQNLDWYREYLATVCHKPATDRHDVATGSHKVVTVWQPNQSLNAVLESGSESVNQSIDDRLTDVFYKIAGKSLGLGKKQLMYFEKYAAIMPAGKLVRIVEKFARDDHDWSKVKQPAHLLCLRFKEYQRQVEQDDAYAAAQSGEIPQEVIEEERARSLAQAQMTEEEFALEVEGKTLEEFKASPRGRKL